MSFFPNLTALESRPLPRTSLRKKPRSKSAISCPHPSIPCPDPKLQSLFGRGRGVEIDRALQILIAAELVEALGGGNFRLNSHSINFAESEDGFSHLDFLKGAMKDAENAVDKWYARADRSFFTWSILSVKRAEYERLLPKLKDQIRVFEADLDGSDADSLIRFNVQVYPIGVERREGTS